MKVIPSKKHTTYVPSRILVGVPHEVLLKETDEDKGEWYLLEAHPGETIRAYNTDSDYERGKIERSYISPNYRGADNHSCAWIRAQHCEEVPIENNKEAIHLLRRN